MDNLPEKLRAFQRIKGLDNYKTSKLIGISVDTLKNWKCGRSKPSADNINKLNKLFTDKSPVDVMKKLKELQKLKHLTQLGLSEFLDMPYQTVVQWLQGKSKPDFDNMVRLEDVFELEGV